jgi:hypothetical protein
MRRLEITQTKCATHQINNAFDGFAVGGQRGLVTFNGGLCSGDWE